MKNNTNKVEAAGIKPFDLIDFKPTTEVISFDLKPLLFMEMIVKEKEFRAALSLIDFSMYTNKAVAVYCSVDAIIPPWVYMVIADKLYPHAQLFAFSEETSLNLELWKYNILTADISDFKDHKVVVRARTDIHPELYMAATTLLKPVVKSLMYGEIGMPKVIFKQ